MSDENVVFMYFFAVKVDGSDVKSGISLHENLFTDSRFDVTLTAKKSMKTTFSSDKIYYNFSQKNPKITDI